MSLPVTLVALVLLLVGAEARAQTSPARERRERTVTVTGNPADPPHEIHAAKGVATLLRFKSQIHRDAIEIDGRGTRITVDAGDSSIILEPLIDLGRDERLVLRVHFASGKAPAQAVFALVSSPSEVDTRIDVVRRELPDPACQVEVTELRARCLARGPLEFARSGYLDRSGIKTTALKQYRDEVGGLESETGVSHLAKGWFLVDVVIFNDSSQPWAPQEVTLTSKAGQQVTVRAMTAEPGEIAPGSKARVFVETEEPTASAGREFVLRMRGVDGRTFLIPIVELTPVKEGKR